MTIYDVLKKDHDELKPMLDQLVETSEHNEDTKHLLQRISNELIPHARAEEAVFYNTLSEFDETKSMVSESYGEHAKAETVLRTLQGLNKINVEWTRAAEKLREDLQHHISEEEGEIFTRARQVFSDEEARQMGEAFERLKSEYQKQGDLKNSLDMVANLMPKRFADRFRRTSAA